MDAEAPIWQGESEQPPEHTCRYVRRQRSEQHGQMGWIGGQTGQVILRRALRRPPLSALEEPLAFQSQQLVIAGLKWNLVLRRKTSWTALSISVLTLMTWGMLARIGGSYCGTLGWILELMAIVSGFIWIKAEHTIVRMEKQISELSDDPAYSMQAQRRRVSPPQLASLPPIA
jgi:hypothetical protein